jgi:hypothetical protein
MEPELREHMAKMCAKSLASANDMELPHPLEYE